MNLNLTRLVFKTHKWLAVGVGLISFLWFFSGIFMTIPPRLLNALGVTESSAKGPRNDYRGVKVSLADAIAAVDRKTEEALDVNRVEFRNIEGLLYYRISTREGVYLVSGQDAALLNIDAEVAQRLAVSKGLRSEHAGTTTLLRSHGGDYQWGPLPAWRIEASDASRTLYYVEVEGGEVRTTNRLGRVRTFLVGLHTLEFLNPYVSPRRIGLIMWVFSIVGTIMTVFGFWILWIQFQNWRQRKIA